MRRRWTTGSRSHKLEVVKKLEIGPNIYIIKTAPGLEALNTANALYLSGEVICRVPRLVAGSFNALIEDVCHCAFAQWQKLDQVFGTNVNTSE